MSNGFTDFFETLLPREITVYVLPGSLVLGTILWRFNFYIYKVNCKLDSATYIFDKVICNSSAATYTILAIIWIAIAYTIGLIMGSIKAGILYKLIRNYGKIGKQICDCFWKSFFNIFWKSFFNKNYEEEDDNSCSKEGEKEDFAAMYISLHQEKMYRREVERYGVFANSLDNLAIAFIFIALLVMTKQISQWYYLCLPSLLLPIGAEGYRKLQRERIRYLKKAIEA
jgi:hypothetical protein